MRPSIKALLLASALFAGISAFADTPYAVVVDGTDGYFNSYTHLRFLKDEDQSLTLADFTDDLWAKDWQTPKKDEPIGRTTSVYWFALHIQNHSDSTAQLMLAFLQHRAHKVEVHFIENGQLLASDFGGLSSPLTQTLFSSRMATPILIEPGKNLEILFRVDAREYLHFDHIILQSVEGFSNFLHGESIQKGVFIGIALAAALLNIILFFALREKSYLIFFFWIVFITQHLLSFSGEGMPYLLPAIPQLNTAISFFFHGAANILTMAFAIMFLSAAQISPKLHKVLLGFIAVQALTLGMNITEILAAIGMPFLLALSIKAWRTGKPYLRWYVACNLILSIYAIALGISAIFLPEYMAAASKLMLPIAIMQMVLVSLAQIDRLYLFKQQKEQSDTAAYTDALTGIANRRALDIALAREVEQCVAQNKPISCLLMDIDHFKQYNDKLGHQQGDKCLQEVAAIIRGCMSRDHDVAARCSSKEFAVVLPGANKLVAHRIAMTILNAMSLKAIDHPASSVGEHVSLSIGGASWSSETSSTQPTPAMLIQEANKQLCAAKEGGRSCYRSESLVVESQHLTMSSLH